MRSVLAVCGSLLLIGIPAYWYGEELSRTLSELIQPTRARVVPLQVLEGRSHRLVFPVSGELAGLETVSISTPRIRTGGLKLSWILEEGTLVKAGMPVVRFDETDAKLSLEENENQHTTFGYQISRAEQGGEGETEALRMDQIAAENELSYSRSQVRRDEEIFSRWEIQESLMSAALALYKKETLERKLDLQSGLIDSDLKILGIEQSKVEAEIDLANETLSSLSVAAPLEGVLIYERLGYFNRIEPGAEVWPGQTLARIARLNQFRGVVYVPEKDISGLKVGVEAVVRLDAFPEIEFNGSVRNVARVAEQREREDPRKYFECDLTLDVPTEMMTAMKPGMAFTAEIVLGRWQEGFLLPKSAVSNQEGEWFAFVRVGEDYLERQVKVLASDHGFYLVTGLEAGQSVCLLHPFEDQKLVLPDFNAPTAGAGRQMFVSFR